MCRGLGVLFHLSINLLFILCGSVSDVFAIFLQNGTLWTLCGFSPVCFCPYMWLFSILCLDHMWNAFLQRGLCVRTDIKAKKKTCRHSEASNVMLDKWDFQQFPVKHCAWVQRPPSVRVTPGINDQTWKSSDSQVRWWKNWICNVSWVTLCFDLQGPKGHTKYFHDQTMAIEVQVSVKMRLVTVSCLTLCRTQV